MPKVNGYKCCCGCGAEKKLTNHWTIVKKSPQETSNGVTFPAEIEFLEWNEAYARRDDVEYLAGDGCCQRLLAQWLTARKLRDQQAVSEATVKETYLA